MSSEFFQDGPELGNTYESDVLLQSYLRRRFAKDFAALEPGWKKLGGRAATDILAMGRQAEAEKPRHVPYDPWGRRIDDVEVSRAWRELDRVSAEEGLIATGYERRHGELSRLDQFARLYLFGASSGFYNCPLAMTDGAARALELYGDEKLKSGAFKHLTSRDPAKFWTSGQWMTERTGGSDVGGTSTIARPSEDGGYRLYGDKWFTSATTAQMAMTLARIEGSPEGSRGLSLFYLELRDGQGRLRDIVVRRLKEKLGTHGLPTAELTLNGTPATLVGGEGGGVKKISTLFNLTRIHNSIAALSTLQRGVVLARDFALRRVAFGKPLSEHPLHRETLAWVETEMQGAFLLTFRAGELLGLVETGKGSADDEAVLRMLTPLAKLMTGKQSIAVSSEVIECFGGVGYCEDSGIPKLLRDAQVYSIWEGTTNVLSLDVLRAMEKESAFGPFLKDLGRVLKGVTSPELAPGVQAAQAAAGALPGFAEAALKAGPDFVQASARNFAQALARTYAGALLLEHAQYSLQAREKTASRFKLAALRWCRGLTVLQASEARAATERLQEGSVLGMGSP